MRKPREDELNPDKVVVVVGTSSIWPRAPAPASISTRVVATPASSSPSVVHGASARVQRRPQDELEPQRWSIAPMPSSPFKHKPFDARTVMGFGVLNGILIGLLNQSLGFNSVGFYQSKSSALFGSSLLILQRLIKRYTGFSAGWEDLTRGTGWR
ncbi:uncharacterized protein [Aegilops tauschii subsp. strangulata]|uniref:uncharacterized protein isoform X2 n=1 Tax=Aegilops tauschii subsp. strangulata TaxID=200361 RepID=UPI001E1CA9ED|nr:uncharacterized protein LOC120962768 isoform X2 [Aegilops tauschii subsp. strangulata]